MWASLLNSSAYTPVPEAPFENSHNHFNNLVVGILGNACLALERLPASHPACPPLQDVVEYSEAIAALVRQLLAYAGKGQFTIALVNLGGVVAGIARLLQSSVPKTINLSFDLEQSVRVAADPSQMQQVAVNLIINAAEAIGPRPGHIRVAVRARDAGQSFNGNGGVLAGQVIDAGQYAVLEVQDDGAGMDETNRARIFHVQSAPGRGARLRCC